MAWQQIEVIEVAAKNRIRKELHKQKRQRKFLRPQKQKSHTKLAWLFNCIF